MICGDVRLQGNNFEILLHEYQVSRLSSSQKCHILDLSILSVFRTPKRIRQPLHNFLDLGPFRLVCYSENGSDMDISGIPMTGCR